MDNVRFKELLGMDVEDYGQYFFERATKPRVDLDRLRRFLQCLESGGTGLLTGGGHAGCGPEMNLGAYAWLDDGTEDTQTRALLNTFLVDRTTEGRLETVRLSEAGRKFLEAARNPDANVLWTIRVGDRVMPWVDSLAKADQFEPGRILEASGLQTQSSETVYGWYRIDNEDRRNIPGEAFLIWRFAPKIVSSWFSSIINPILRGLKDRT
jgi:hypothetical protein